MRAAQAAHALAPTSCVALGRLLTAAGLVAVTQKREGQITLQVISKGRLRQVVADANHEGHLRGYVHPSTLAFPLSPEEREQNRRSVSAGALPGRLSVVRRTPRGEYAQSAVELETGEIDLDVQHFLERSDQVPTALAADVLMKGSEVEVAGGVLIQAMPDGDLVRLAELRAELDNGGFARKLREVQDPQALLQLVQPDAEVVEVPVIMTWRCRCSHERVVRSLQLLEPVELAEMIEQGEPVDVDCDFCAKKYSVSVDEMRDVFELIAKAKG